jgi:hypothetical protein
MCRTDEDILGSGALRHLQKAYRNDSKGYIHYGYIVYIGCIHQITDIVILYCLIFFRMKLLQCI